MHKLVVLLTTMIFTSCWAVEGMLGERVSSGSLKVSVTSTAAKPAVSTIKYLTGRVLTKGHKVYYQTAKLSTGSKPKLPILFLHGAAFSSQTWRNLGTLRFLARHGYNPIAIDLPGFGKTKGYYRGNTNDFMDEIIADLGIERPILVSPSMSGRFSIPYVIGHSSKLRGFIPVAPSNYGGTAEKFRKINLPALIIYGTRDSWGKRTSEIIGNIPGSKIRKIPNGGHPAYLDNPKLFHGFVKNFLDGIYASEIAVIESNMASNVVNTTAPSTANSSMTTVQS